MHLITTEVYNILKHNVSPQMAERDYLECLILNELFQDDYIRENFVFAGGAALTKCDRVSYRISNDVDLTCSDFTELAVGRTKRQLNKFKKEFKTYVFNVLRDKINAVTNHHKQFMIVTDRDWRALASTEEFMSSPTLHMLYKSKFCSDVGHIQIEIIPRKYNPLDVSYRAVVPYSTRTPIGNIPTVVPQQTFWDKIFALHSIATTQLPKSATGISRHYYDVATICSDVDLNATKHMFENVARYQDIYTTKSIGVPEFRDIVLIPNNSTRDTLRHDYAGLRGMIIGGAPQWDAIEHALRALGIKINELSQGR